jgi:hypothetical protein
MTIETAHKVLIGTALVFFVLYAFFEASRWQAGGGGAALARGAAGGLAAAGIFAVYLRSYVRGLRRP